ncbi:hypothetical protein [Actinoplanes sp. NPDC051851]|uniref:hypothetical protein n=1 Tax=Actinoplanes sp. NPDC051851 TaxID=3154753 RepID=UPI0034227272
MTMDDVLCLCGHPRRAHDHYRPGSECSACPAGECPRFRRATWWRRLLRLP